jgi:hypothetical protein
VGQWEGDSEVCPLCLALWQLNCQLSVWEPLSSLLLWKWTWGKLTLDSENSRVQRGGWGLRAPGNQDQWLGR